MGRATVSSHNPRAEHTSDQAAIGHAVGVAFVYLEALDRATLASVSPPVTTAQYHALVALDAAPRRSLRDLADRLLCDKANASGIVDRLEGMGLVDRTRTVNDRRRVSISLTGRGKQVLLEANKKRASSIESIFQGLDGDEIASIAGALARLVETLEHAHQRGAAASRAGGSHEGAA